MEQAEEKLDLLDATETGMLITSSLAFGLGILYALAYLELIGEGLLGNIPFSFVVLSLIVTFNLTFAIALIDQLRS